MLRRDRASLEEHPGVASVDLSEQRTPEGYVLTYRVVPSQVLIGAALPDFKGKTIAEIQVRGNARIDADAIRTRVGSTVGGPLNPVQVAADIRAIFGLGFFDDVRAYTESSAAGEILIFHVEENPVVRQITISGNDNVDGEKIRDILTLTTGSTLDRALLTTNVIRIEALYRAEGYYLADVGFEIEKITDGSVAVHFDVNEKDKLRLKKVVFVGNEAFSDKELREEFATKLWRFWSPLTSWFDKSGTYSEPIFMRDLRTVEKIYTDHGYLQVQIGEPQVDPSEEGL